MTQCSERGQAGCGRPAAGADAPWTIVRGTQFPAVTDQLFALTAGGGVLPAAGIPLQPVDPREVATLLADTAEADASGTTTQFAGPEVRTLRELALEWREA